MMTWSEGDEAPVPATTLPALLAARAAATPRAVAVRDDRVTLTYERLHARANRLAYELIAAGAGPEKIVAVAVARSADLVVALLAVLKTGAAYLPIDPDHPAERIRFTLGDAAVTAVVAGPGVGLPESTAPVLLVTDGEDPVAPPLRGGPGDAAYVIYTSGSTGRPKGAVIEHAAIVNRLAWMQD